MAKSKKKQNKEMRLYLSIGCLVLGLVATCMMFLEAVNFKGLLSTSSYTGLQVAFGYSETTKILGSDVVTKHLNMNFLGLLGFLLPVVGGALAVVFGKSKGLLQCILPATLMIVGGVLLFLMPSYFISGIASEEIKSLLEGAEVVVNLGTGPIIGGVCAIIGGLASALKIAL